MTTTATALTPLKLQITADDFDKLQDYLEARKGADTLCAVDAEQKAADAEREICRKIDEETRGTTAHVKALKDAADEAAEKAQSAENVHKEWHRRREEWFSKVLATGNLNTPMSYDRYWFAGDLDKILKKKEPEHSAAFIYNCEEYLKAHSKVSSLDLRSSEDGRNAQIAKKNYQLAVYRADVEAASNAAEIAAAKEARAGAGAKTREAATQAKAEVTSAYAALPEALRDLSRERMEALFKLHDWHVKDAVHAAEWGLIRAEDDPENLPWHIRAAMYRGEIPLGPLQLRSDGTRRDEKLRWCSDFVHRTLSMGVEVIWGFETQSVQYRDNFDPSHIEKVVPKKFRGHSLANLKPWLESPVPQVQQQKYIDLLRYRVDHDEEPENPENPEKQLKNPVLYGWMMTGCKDGGTSKSTMASAYLKDVITDRLTDAQDEYGVDVNVDLCVWRIRVPEWIDDMEKHKHHDFGTSDRPPEPEVTVAAIRQAVRKFGEKMNWQPVLWIEEMDKIKATDTRLSWLFNLIDVIYEDKGLLITTTNLTIVELKAMLGGPRLRRLTGKHDKAAHYLVWDFHKYQPRTGPV